MEHHARVRDPFCHTFAQVLTRLANIYTGIVRLFLVRTFGCDFDDDVHIFLNIIQCIQCSLYLQWNNKLDNKLVSVVSTAIDQTIVVDLTSV